MRGDAGTRLSLVQLRLRSASGLLVTLGTLLAIEILYHAGYRIPYPLPILITAVVYTTFISGLRIGFLSVVLTLMFAAYHFSTPDRVLRYTPDHLQRIITIFLTLPIITLLVGVLKRRSDLQTSNELRASDERFRATFEQAAVGLTHVEIDGRWLRVNQRFCDIVGYTRDELLASKFQDITHPEDIDADLHQMGRLLAGDIATYSMEKRYIRKDGTIIWINLTVSLIRDGQATPQYFIAVVEDIAERKLAEEALRQSEARYRILFDANPEALWVYDRETLKFLAINDAAITRYGYSREEFLSMTILEIRPQEDRTAFLQMLNTPRQDTTRFTSGHRHQKKDGSIIWVDVASHLIEFGVRPAALVLASDVTKREQTEIALAAEKEQLAVTLRSISDGVITTDTDGRIVMLNAAAEQMTGWMQAEAAGQSIGEVFPIVNAQTHEWRESLVERALQSDSNVELSGNTILLSRHSRQYIITASAAPIRNRQREPIGGVLIFRDITERERLEQQLRQAQRMESIGVLAGGIAHDFNNLLTGIIGIADLALMDLAEDHQLKADLQDIKNQGQRGAELTKQLLAFSRRQVLAPQPVDLNATIRDVLSFLRRVLGGQIILQFEPFPQLITAHVDPVQVEQVLLNLCVNARDAMPNGGTITITTANIVADDAFCRSYAGAELGNYVCVTVADTGIGMDQETLQHIFEPFFSTKPVGSGTGLGLAMVYGIVKQHNGIIDVTSELGRGTTFSIFFRAEHIPPQAS